MKMLPPKTKLLLEWKKGGKGDSHGTRDRGHFKRHFKEAGCQVFTRRLRSGNEFSDQEAEVAFPV